MRSHRSIPTAPTSSGTSTNRQWVRPLLPEITPAPVAVAEHKDMKHADADVHFNFDGEALRVTGCEPLFT